MFPGQGKGKRSGYHNEGDILYYHAVIQFALILYVSCFRLKIYVCNNRPSGILALFYLSGLGLIINIY